MTRAVPVSVASLLLTASLLAAAAPAARAEGAAATRRLAVVVGANAAAPGRKPLRFAQVDARAVAQVLRDQGGFASGDVHLLLDPQPDEVLKALDAALREAGRASADTLILFYYSGHADTASLFPSGRPLALELLRQRLEDERAAMRIGIIDACRGGGWTGSKGLSESTTFAIEQALDVSTQGSVLIASSSGLEDAHESVNLRGSFFTHHWNAAMRGAADRNGDDKVTLTEAFEYARALTIRDTALQTVNPQHPSFRFNLRGRGDPLLAELTPGSSVVELAQTRGPLQVIHLGTGLLVVELPPGRRQVRVSLPPGRYVVRRRQGDDVVAREVRLEVGQHVAVREASLEAVAGGKLATKGAGQVTAEPPPPRIAPPSEWMLSFSWGRPRFDSSINGQGVVEGYPETRADPSWSVELGHLWRHGRYLGTRGGLGFARPQSFGDGAVSATVGEAISWPLLELRHPVRGTSPHAIEPYLAAQMTARYELEADQRDEIRFRLQGGLAAGVRLFAFYAQFGYALDLLPRDVTIQQVDSTVYLSDPHPGPVVEVGMRLTGDIF